MNKSEPPEDREGPGQGQNPIFERHKFLTAQARGIVAADFVHVDTILLQRIYALIVIEHGTRRAHLAASPPLPTVHGPRKQHATS
jgi:hypothetical protein